MATAPSAPRPTKNKEGATLPPRRGRVKAQIFQSLAEAVSSLASKAISKIGGGGGDSSTHSSTAMSGPPSAYASDGYGDDQA
ncbi:UNVERIFIED_CONTAM: hypothetical protein Sangu_0322500 [Sesamum angustifolium]|uniref:Uncharacterized protein n=1 Tax=Sesamum angustifolium TaxID=2727405 RepID=A0AAW2QQT9_9LAMI